MLKIDFANHVSREAFERFGEVVSFNPPEVKLRIAREATSRVTQQIIDTVEVRDLTVEDPPIEEIFALIFAEHSEDADAQA